MVRRGVLLVFALALGFGLAGDARGDVVTLKDGERLSGELNEMGEGVLTFRSKLAGKVYYPFDEVAGITTTRFVLVTLNDDVVVPGRLRYADGEQRIYNRTKDEERPLELASVTAIETLPESEQPPTEDPDTQLNASLATGYTFRDGTVDYSGPTADLRISGQSEKLDLETGVRAEYVGDAGSFDRFYKGDLDITLRTSDIWKPFVTVEAERNRDKAIDFRGEVTTGVQRQLHRDGRQSLEGRAGLGAAIERYDVRPLRRDQGRPAGRILGDPTRTDEDLNLHLSLRYSRALFEDSYLHESLTVLPSLTDAGEFRAAWQSSLDVPITANIRVKFDLLIDYEEDLPYDHLEDWRTSLGASIQLDF